MLFNGTPDLGVCYSMPAVEWAKVFVNPELGVNDLLDSRLRRAFSGSPASSNADIDLLMEEWAQQIVLGGKIKPLPLKLAYEPAKWPALSMIQKGIRRGKLDWTIAAASAMVNSGMAHAVWRRMGVIALEDLGLPGLPYLCLILHVLDEPEWLESEITFDLMAPVLQMMCESVKDRSACDIASVLGIGSPNLHAIRMDMPSKPVEIEELLNDSTRPLIARVMANRKLSTGKGKAPIECYDSMKTPGYVRYACERYKAAYKDTMWTGLPVLWDVMICGNTPQIIVNENKDIPTIRGVPACCFDMFTAIGKKAMAFFKQDCAPVAKFFEGREMDYGPALSYAVFAVEGGELDRHLGYEHRNDIAIETLEEEFVSVGLPLLDAIELCELVDEYLPLLHEKRAKVLTHDLLLTL